jgi:G3E family GTPase
MLPDVLFHSAGQHSIVHDCRLVLENSGVAEPHAIRDRFMQATEANRPLMQRLRLDTLVTVCPVPLFWHAVSMHLRGGAASKLGTARRQQQLRAAQVLDCGSFLADYASRAPVMSRPKLGEGGNLRPVVDLLVEQLECVRPCTLMLAHGAAAETLSLPCHGIGA